MRTVAYKTLGCKVNSFETNAVLDLFRDANYQLVEFDDIADVYIINTCTVTNSGDRKSRQAIRQAVRRNPEAVVAVMGCYAQTKPNEIQDIAGVDIIVGTHGREKMVEYVEQFLESRQPILDVNNIMKQKDFESLSIVSIDKQTRAYVKIQDGCNNFCTFCIIPWARGLVRSEEPQKVLDQVKKVVNLGVKEIVLTGIHTGAYGEDLEDYDMADLLLDLEKIDGLKRIRISSIEINQLDQKMLKVIANSTKVVEHLHVPIQAGNDETLKRMRRNYNLREYKNKISEIRSILPNIALTTDVIVGFPGEMETEFTQTVATIKELAFSELHVFPYSKRSGTPAARMEDQVPDQMKKEHVKELLQVNVELAEDFAQMFKGDVLDVLVERRNKNGNFEGHTNNYIRIEFPADVEHDLKNQIVNVRLDKVSYPLNQGTLIS